MFGQRSTAAEWMDDAAATEPEFAGALRDLARINHLSDAYRPTLRWLDALVERRGATELSVLDVGCGGGDMLAAIAAWAKRRGIAVRLTGLDRSPWAARYTAAAGVPARVITADLFDLDPAARFDVILCSLFTHHLDDAQLVRFLRWLDHHAVRGWLISDLHRHWLPWGFVWAATRAMRMDPMVIHDSTISIARGFRRADWQRLTAAAGTPAEIRWAIPFRWIVSRVRCQGG
ncbi:methyltransferase domain-containing protein [Paeniroseomonas aquatica]|uniref:Methyltransferase domain-containing protein n=1 Tax=Paeniroseomonas aquatica TaxID=373043 RepID=A0ABT8A7C7_9PROT|nr:methyltransferase domain-containing protein [Paeniroseomonas aquatica]MDN3565565.1 methyltransferase domain-containing protein [Paeniroseomonas aquatica]